MVPRAGPPAPLGRRAMPRPWWPSAVCATVLLGCGRSPEPTRQSSQPDPTAPSPAQAQPPEWTSDPSAARDLADPVELREYAIHPPKGYRLAARDELPGGTLTVPGPPPP